VDLPWYSIFAILALILANGFFAAAEIAILTLRKSRILQLAEGGKHRAKDVQRLQADPERFLATIQIGITVISALTGAVGGVTAIEHIKPYLEGIPNPVLRSASEGIALTIVVVSISYLSLVFGELVPKSLALRYPEQIALWVAWPIDGLARMSSVAVKILTWSSRLILKPLGAPSRPAFMPEEEIKSLLLQGRESGVIDSTEQELIHSVFEFADISVKEVMIPAPRIHAIKLDTPLEAILADIVENKFSRYPVYREDLNDTCGVVYTKDILDAMVRRLPIDLKALMHSAYFVPESMKVSHLLKEMQRRHTQMAVVVNEFGGVMGIVTLEDLLEEVVGEIMDETDITEELIKRLGKNHILVHSRTEVRKVNDFLKVDLGDEAVTIGGLIQQELGRIPKVGEEVRIANCRILIHEAEPRSIRSVQIFREEKSPAPVEAPNLDLVS